MNDPFLDHKEPEEIFLPLGEERYAEFYSIEMNDFIEDIIFYLSHCTKGSHVLELGCGTGRISEALASSGCRVTSIDLSRYMLTHSQRPNNSNPSYVCMDMTRMAFRIRFDHILIPYNTLNLLRDESAIHSCLRQAHELLKPEGSLLLQLFIPSRQLIELNGHRLFQFQVFPLEETKGQLIKETLRCFLPEKKEIRLEERYRFRSLQQRALKEDFSHTLHLAGFPRQQWLNLLEKAGFHNLTLYDNYNSNPSQSDNNSLLLIKAEIL